MSHDTTSNGYFERNGTTHHDLVLRRPMIHVHTPVPTPPAQPLIASFLELAVNALDYTFGRYRRVYLWDNEPIDWRAALMLAEPGDLLRVKGHGKAINGTILIEVPRTALDMTKALVQRSELLRWVEP